MQSHLISISWLLVPGSFKPMGYLVSLIFSNRLELSNIFQPTHCFVLFCRGTFGCRSLRSIRTCPKTELGIRNHHGTIRVSANGSTSFSNSDFNSSLGKSGSICQQLSTSVIFSFCPGTVRTGSKIFFRAQGVHCQVA